MLVWIKAWIGAGSASTTSVTLTAPPVQAAGGSKQFPADPTAGSPSFATTVYPLLKQYCAGCHTSSSATAQQPYFASSDVNEAYAAAQPKMNLSQPNQSRFYERLDTEFHHCWATQSGGAPDCPGSAAAMLAAITAFANGIPVTPIDPALVVSNAVTLKQGTIAAGGDRYEANLVAKYMFQTGSGNTAYDTSGVDAGGGPDPVRQRQLGGRLGHQRRHGRQGAGLHQRQPEVCRDDPVLGRVLDRGVGCTGERDADECLHRQLLRQQYDA